MPTSLTTDRVVLRTFHDDDAGALFDLHSRAEVQRWIGDGQPMTDVAEAHASIPRRRLPFPEPMGIWAIDLDGRMVGTILLKPIPVSGSPLAADPRTMDLAHALDSPDVEIGWHLHPDVWGRGIATEAATRVLDHASGLPRVVAVTHPDNEPSQRVARRLGMRDEGLTDRYYDTTTRLFVLER
ncbi:GNAT family N-acetyltransferase [Janibacter indicus]